MKKKIALLTKVAILSAMLISLASCQGTNLPTPNTGSTSTTTVVTPNTTSTVVTPSTTNGNTTSTTVIPSTTNGNTTTTTTTTKNYVVIEDKEKEIPTNLTFSGEATGVTANLSIGSMNVGTYSDKNFMSSAKTLDGVSMMAYRAVGGSGYVTIKPDSYFYKDTTYHGAEGSIFNSVAVKGINSIEVTYKTTDSEASSKTNPNVTFGTSLECDNYLYYLEPSSTDKKVTINVNNSGFKYFSINTGDYTTKVSNVVLKCDSKTGESTAVKAASGEGKYRVNPITLDKSKLVPGQTKVTLPTNIAYDALTKTYSATESKTLTYYTLDFVDSHPSVTEDATITDPMEVCMYYTTFGTWPANYGEDSTLSSVKSIFGNDARKVSTYSRKNGYATSVPFNDNGYFVYYELDINYDGTYRTNSRGTGRVVAWDLGFTTSGYTKAPVCLYTDDHYNTWLEYYNNGTWSNRFNAEGVVTGVKYSAPTTVELTDFDYNVVAGDANNPIPAETGGEAEEGINTSTQIAVNDLLYYANFAPTEIFNSSTATFQKVTNMRGIVDGAKYVIAYSSDSSMQVDKNNDMFTLDGKALKLTYPEYGYQNISVYTFEKAENGEYRMYVMKFDESNKYSLSNPGKTGKDLSYGDGTFTIGFKDGNFVLTGKGVTYQYNTDAGKFRMYKSGSQSQVQLYRYCDLYEASDLVYNTDITTDETSRFRKASNELALIDGSSYLVVCASNSMCLTDDPDKAFIQAFDELYTDSDTYFELKLTKHETENKYAFYYLDWNNSVYYLGFKNNHISFDETEPVWFNITFDLIGNVEIKYNDYYLAFGNDGYDLYTGSANKEPIQLYRLCGNKKINPVAPDPSVPEDSVLFEYVTDVSSISEEHEYVIASKEDKTLLRNFGLSISFSKTNKLAIPEEAFTYNYLSTIHFVKHETYDVYAMYFYLEIPTFDEELGQYVNKTVKTYYKCNDNEYYFYTLEEIQTYYQITIDADGEVHIKPCRVTESGVEPILYYGEQPEMKHYELYRDEFYLDSNPNYDSTLYLYQIS